MSEVGEEKGKKRKETETGRRIRKDSKVKQKISFKERVDRNKELRVI